MMILLYDGAILLSRSTRSSPKCDENLTYLEECFRDRIVSPRG